MDLGWIDLVVFVGFMGAVLGLSIWMSRKESSGEDFFLAGRKLVWYLIGFSLLASNISTEHFVGMSGMGFTEVGMGVANWEWMSAICMVFIAWWLLPYFIKAGIYTMPEFLEYRYDSGARTIMGTYHFTLYIIALLSMVLFSGSVIISTIFDIPSMLMERFGMTAYWANFWSSVIGIWIIGAVGATYTIYGGLKACVWADLLQGSGLIIGGFIVLLFGLKACGDGSWSGLWDGWVNLKQANAAQLHIIKPWNHWYAPWPGTIFGGLWILNIHYWGLNQFITQRTLGAKSLAEGQKGVIFGASLKLLIPFIIVIPGVMAAHLYGPEILALGEKAQDKAYSYMMANLLPPYLRGVILAALCGAVMSTFTAGLNSAATLFTHDYYNKFINKNADPSKQLRIGRIVTTTIGIIACLWAPIIYFFQGVFVYIQEMWSFIAAGIVTAFLMGLIFPRGERKLGRHVLLMGPPIYALVRYSGKIWLIRGMENVLPWLGGALQAMNAWSFLYLQLIVFGILVLYYLIMTARSPMAEPIALPVANVVDTKVHPQVYALGLVVIGLQAFLYWYFW